jgi:UDP-N-acetylglucosamine 3-dehydrogenase
LNRLKVAVIGCGSWGRNHVRVYDELENASLIAVCDSDSDTSSEIGEKYRVDWYVDPSELLDRDDVDAVSVCTPTRTHMDVSMQVLESGRHLLVEKPMTDTVEEAKTLIRKAETEELFICVGFVERFNPAVLEARRIIERGVIGEIILARSTRVSRRPPRVGDVGVIKDLAIHEVDMVNHLFDYSVQSVYATTGSISHDFEDHASILLRLENGRDAIIEANWLTPRKVRSLVLTGTEGVLTVQYQTQEVTVENHQRLYMPYIEREEPLLLELRNFAQCIIEERPPQPTGAEGLVALEICEAALLSSELGRAVMMRS